jgi:sugar fermentation stimulation protein A
MPPQHPRQPPRFTFPWPTPLVVATLLRRRDRFLADAVLPSGEAVVAHCVNPGAMEGVVRPGARVWLTPVDHPARKLKFTWSVVEDEGVRVGADTSLPNRLVRAMLEARALRGFAGCGAFVPEFVHAPGCRVDFRLSTRRGPHDLEVKNCHLRYPDGRGYFPDSVSERATKHLAVLSAEAARGVATTVLFVVQRPDVTAVRPSDVHDPTFAAAARAAAAAGVRFRALRASVGDAGVTVEGEVPVDLAPYDLAGPRAWRAALRPLSGWVKGPRKT